jgi:GNAT superfamily N-acetyltransferase
MGRAEGYIRTDMPPLFPTHLGENTLRCATLRDSALVADFLLQSYRGADWKLCDPHGWVSAYLSDSDVICLILERPDKTLAGCIFSVPFSASETIVTSGAIIRCLRVIEGLAVASDMRGRGVAGFLIAHMDAWTSYKFGVCAHIWSREVAIPVLFSTALNVATYGYRVCGLRDAGTGGTSSASSDLHTIPWETLVAQWRASAPAWAAAVGGAAFIATAPAKQRRGAMVAYAYENLIAIVCNTGRVTTTGDLPIYEVIWCGVKLRNEKLLPASAAGTVRYKVMLDNVAEQIGRGILFATDDPLGGAISSSWEGWIYGRSGAHATYIYNYIPPAFGTCRIHCLREEI